MHTEVQVMHTEVQVMHTEVKCQFYNAILPSFIKVGVTYSILQLILLEWNQISQSYLLP